MNRRHFVTPYICGLAALAMSATLCVHSVQAGQNEDPIAAGLSFDPNITSDLAAVPEFAQVVLPRPYTKTWQIQLLAFHASFVAERLEYGMRIDRLTTGSASD